MAEPAPGDPIVLWDLPVRLTHWGFVLLLPALYFSAEWGRMDLHILFGETMLALLVFRILWGFAGSHTARFASFLRGPRAILAYLKGTPVPPGHNPLGAWSVFAMLALLSLQVSLGLFASDTDGLYSGPLDRFVSYSTSREIGEWHESVFDYILVLVALHIAAIAWYALVRRDGLIRPMISGKRTLPGTHQPPLASMGLAMVLAAISALLAWWIAGGMRPL